MIDLPRRDRGGPAGPRPDLRLRRGRGQADRPDGYGDYQAGKAAAETQLGVDIEEDLIGQLEGDVGDLVSRGRQVGVRIQLKDPRPFSDTLDKLGQGAPRHRAGHVAAGRLREAEAGGDFTVPWPPPTATAMVYGVVDGVFVLSNDPRAGEQLRRRGDEGRGGREGPDGDEAPTPSSWSSRRCGAAAGTASAEALGGGSFTGRSAISRARWAPRRTASPAGSAHLRLIARRL